MPRRLVGSLNSLWRFPVKSMRGEPIARVEVTSRGLVGDRAFGLIDLETGKVVSAKSIKLFPDILGCRASFVESPRVGNELPPIRIELPNGKVVMSDSPDVDGVLSSWFRRNVTLARAAPDNFTIDMFHPDIGDPDATGPRDEVVEQKLGSAYFAENGVPSPVPPDSFFDCFPVSVLTTSTLLRLGELRPESNFDLRRFRMNVIVDTERDGFVENDWVGQPLGIGTSLVLNVAAPDARCVMTTLAQDDLSKDIEVLRTLNRYNKIPVSSGKKYPCAGVYAVVKAEGVITVGDVVSVG